MIRLLFFFCITCTLSLPALLKPQIQTTHDPQTGISFSDSISNLKLSDSYIYEDKRLGVSATYRDTLGTTATIYIYKKDYDTLEDGITSHVVRKEFDLAVSTLRLYEELGEYVDVKEVDQSTLEIDTFWEKFRFLYANYNFKVGRKGEDPEEQVNSRIFITINAGFFVKIRFTSPLKSADGASSLSFVKEICALLMAHSLNTYWLNEDDFRNSEATVIKVTQWLAENPLNPPDKIRALAMNFAFTWFSKVSYLTITINSDPLMEVISSEDCSCESFLIFMYSLGCGLHALQSGKEDMIANNVSGLEYVIETYRNMHINHTEDCCPTMKNLIKLAERNSLANLFNE